MKRLCCLATLLTFSIAGSEGYAQEIGDTQNGLAWAQQVCSECHAIRRGQVRSPNTRSPTFSELATTPGMTVGALMSR
jgi:mono/diheme cytochrome c family protein